MIINMEYADKTVIQEHEDIVIYGNDDEHPIIVIKGNTVTCHGMDDHYSMSPSEDFGHLKVFLLDA